MYWEKLVPPSCFKDNKTIKNMRLFHSPTHWEQNSQILPIMISGWCEELKNSQITLHSACMIDVYPYKGSIDKPSFRYVQKDCLLWAIFAPTLSGLIHVVPSANLCYLFRFYFHVHNGKMQGVLTKWKWFIHANSIWQKPFLGWVIPALIIFMTSKFFDDKCQVPTLNTFSPPKADYKLDLMWDVHLDIFC
jgi:hypothetical protein